MTLPNTNPTATAVWEKLNQHYQNIKNVSMQEMFRNDTSRAEKFHIQWNDFLIDYSKNRISSETMELLQQLAKEVNLKQAISSYFEAISYGPKINARSFKCIRGQTRWAVATGAEARENA
jgi:glucose-6-phosphate isomerase